MKFRPKLVLTIAAIFASVACKARIPNDASDVKFYGFDNQRFQLQFENDFLMPVTTDDKKILDEAFLSLKFLFGVFQWHNEFVANKGIPHKNPAITIISKDIVNVAGVEKLKVKYRFDDFVVFSKDLKKTSVEFWMPKERASIYQRGMEEIVAETPATEDQAPKKPKNLCTDDNYNSEGDFWYFWNPDKKGCPPAFKEDLNKVSAVFRPIPNTLNKYPLFGKLGSPKQTGVNGKRLIYVTHGVDKNFDATDVGVLAFLGTISELEKLGFTQKEKLVDEANGKHWVYTATANGYEIELHTGLYKSKVWQDREWKDNKDFYDYVRAGLTNADIFVYNGHSGLGGTLPPSKFPQLKLPAKYQVFFFNGCSTFSYYNDNYFEKKRETTGRPGSESMEIVTSGLETFFGLQKFMTSSLINDLAITPNYPKWENIITNLYNQTSKFKYGDKNQWQMDPKIYSGQYQVNGDEDNPSDLATALKW